MIRSVLAVLAGIGVLTVTSFAIEAAADPLMMRMFPHALPNEAAMSQNVPAKLFMIFYTMLCVAAGGYVTAWVASRSKAWHAVIMGATEAALTVWLMIKIPSHAPLWSWILGIGLIVPAAWIGGVIRAKRTKMQPS